MRISPGRDERQALLLADVASAYEAGLSTEQILNGPATASLPGNARASLDATHDATLAQGLQQRGLELAPHEQLILETAESAGTIGRALRTLSERRTRRAELTREVIKKLAYPTFLLGFGLCVSLIACRVTGTSIWTPILMVIVLVGGTWAVVKYAMRSTQGEGTSLVPIVGPLVANFGEIPYLQSLHGLYGAGVNLVDAHEAALKTSPVPGIRMRLFQAGQSLAKGTGYADALQHAQALHPETRQMLTSAELSGDLEEALARAIVRREQSLELQTRWLARIAVTTISILVYGFAAYVIFSFYLNLYGNVLGKR